MFTVNKRRLFGLSNRALTILAVYYLILIFSFFLSMPMSIVPSGQQVTPLFFTSYLAKLVFFVLLLLPAGAVIRVKLDMRKVLILNELKNQNAPALPHRVYLKIREQSPDKHYFYQMVNALARKGYLDRSKKGIKITEKGETLLLQKSRTYKVYKFISR